MGESHRTHDPPIPIPTRPQMREGRLSEKQLGDKPVHQFVPGIARERNEAVWPHPETRDQDVECHHRQHKRDVDTTDAMGQRRKEMLQLAQAIHTYWK